MKSRDRLSLKLGDSVYIDGRSYGVPLVGPYIIDRDSWLAALRAYDSTLGWHVDYWPVTKLSFRVLGNTR